MTRMIHRLLTTTSLSFDSLIENAFAEGFASLA
jgi:hypothetical protein